MTHIDPFAPGDSPQHPSNFRQDVKHWPAMPASDARKYEGWWNRYATEPERSEDVQYPTPFEEMQRRNEEYEDLFELFATPEEREEGAEFVPQPVLLRRTVDADLPEEADRLEWAQLFETHATDAERDQYWVDAGYPELETLRARRDEATEQQELIEALAEPKSSASKDEVATWAVRVAESRGETLSYEDAFNNFTIKELRETYGTAVQD